MIPDHILREMHWLPAGHNGMQALQTVSASFVRTVARNKGSAGPGLGLASGGYDPFLICSLAIHLVAASMVRSDAISVLT